MSMKMNGITILMVIIIITQICTIGVFAKTKTDLETEQWGFENQLTYLTDVSLKRRFDNVDIAISNLENKINELKQVQPKEEWVSLGEFTLTAYCPCSKCCGKWANGITSTGATAKEGVTIAVDPKKIPYGSKVKINGHTYIAQDCGGAIKNNKIDIYFDSHYEALKFGRQKAEVFVLKEVN